MMSLAARAKYNFGRMLDRVGGIYEFRSERRGQGTYDPATGNETPAAGSVDPVNVRMIVSKFESLAPDGITVIRTRMALIPADAGVIPDEGDTVVIDGSGWRITARPAAKYIGDTLLCYRCLLGGG